MGKKKNTPSFGSPTTHGSFGARHGYAGDGEWNSNQKAKLRGEAPSGGFQVGGTLPPTNSPPRADPFQGRYNPGNGGGASTGARNPVVSGQQVLSGTQSAASAADMRPKTAGPDGRVTNRPSVGSGTRSGGGTSSRATSARLSAAARGPAMSLQQNVDRGGFDLRREAMTRPDTTPDFTTRVQAPITNSEFRVGRGPESPMQQTTARGMDLIRSGAGESSYSRAARGRVFSGDLSEVDEPSPSGGNSGGSSGGGSNTARNVGLVAAGVLGAGALALTRSPRVAAAVTRMAPRVGPMLVRGATTAVNAVGRAGTAVWNGVRGRLNTPTARTIRGAIGSAAAGVATNRAVTSGDNSATGGTDGSFQQRHPDLAPALTTGAVILGGGLGGRNMGPRTSSPTPTTGMVPGRAPILIRRPPPSPRGLPAMGESSAPRAGLPPTGGSSAPRAGLPPTGGSSAPRAATAPVVNPSGGRVGTTNGSMSSSVTGAIAARPVTTPPAPRATTVPPRSPTVPPRAASVDRRPPQINTVSPGDAAAMADLSAAGRTPAAPAPRTRATSPRARAQAPVAPTPPPAPVEAPSAPVVRRRTLPPEAFALTQHNNQRSTVGNPAPDALHNGRNMTGVSRAPLASGRSSTPAPSAPVAAPVAPTPASSGGAVVTTTPGIQRPGGAMNSVAAERVNFLRENSGAPIPRRLSLAAVARAGRGDSGSAPSAPTPTATPAPARTSAADALRQRGVVRPAPSAPGTPEGVAAPAQSAGARTRQGGTPTPARGRVGTGRGADYTPSFSSIDEFEGFAGASGTNHGAFGKAKGGGLVRGEPNKTPVQSNHYFGRSNSKF